MAQDWDAMAHQVLADIGGAGNVARLTHCATRLRLQLKDESKINDAAIRATSGVITTVSSGGQYQIVIGNDVPFLYQALNELIAPSTSAHDDDDSEDSSKGPVGRFIAMISSIFLPVIWVLSGTGLLSAILLIFTRFGWLDTESQTYAILHSAGDCVLYFLPVFLAVTSAKRFKMNQFIAMALGCALVYPDIIALADAESVHFFGIPVAATNYTYSVIPIILTVWVASKLEHWLDKHLASNFRNFTTPLLVVLIMVPLVLLTIGPATSWIANSLAGGLEWLWSRAPVVGGFILGAAWQPLVVFGVHWGVWPVIINDIQINHFSHLSAPLLPAVFGMCGATLGVFLRTRNKQLKELAGPATITGILAGITEPAIYGVTLPLRKPFVYGVIGGAIGGAISAAGGGGTTAFALPGGLTIPTYFGVGNFAVVMIGTGIAFVVPLVLTLVLGFHEDTLEEVVDPVEAEVHEEATALVESGDAVITTGDGTGTATAVAGSTQTATAVAGAPGAATSAQDFPGVDIVSPVKGTFVPLDQVNDKVFSSGVMGQGFGVRPAEGDFYAPFDATVLVAPDSGHAVGLRSTDGVELLIHIGLDTVELKGQHFTQKVHQGDTVLRGQLLMTADLDAIAEAGYDTTTIVVVSNSKKFSSISTLATGELDTTNPVLMVE